jgi:hypothetical protein
VSRSAYTLELHQYQVGVDSGFIASNQAILDAIDLPEELLNQFPLVVPCASGKVSKLYFLDMRSLRHKAFEDVVVLDSGSVASDRHVAQTINSDIYDTASLYNGCVAGKASVLYSYVPIQFQTNTVTTLNVTVATSNTDSKYRISDTPVINAKYVSNTNNVTVTVLNRKSAYGIRFYGADGVANNFNLLANINVGDSNTNITFDNSLSNASAYKYKVSYFVSGNINSTLNVFEGTRCQPSYLLGD